MVTWRLEAVSDVGDHKLKEQDIVDGSEPAASFDSEQRGEDSNVQTCQRDGSLVLQLRYATETYGVAVLI